MLSALNYHRIPILFLDSILQAIVPMLLPMRRMGLGGPELPPGKKVEEEKVMLVMNNAEATLGKKLPKGPCFLSQEPIMEHPEQGRNS